MRTEHWFLCAGLPHLQWLILPAKQAAELCLTADKVPALLSQDAGLHQLRVLTNQPFVE